MNTIKILLLLSLVSLTIKLINPLKPLSNSKFVDEKVYDSIPTKEQVYEYMLSIRTPHAHVGLAQCITETGWLKSKKCLRNKNLFGMKYPLVRPTMAIGKDSFNYAIYRNWKESVIDYALWQTSTKAFSSNNYKNTLNEKHYCENSNYGDILNGVMNSNTFIETVKTIDQKNLTKKRL